MDGVRKLGAGLAPPWVRGVVAGLLVGGLALSHALPASAAKKGGGLDKGFGSKGKVTTDFGGTDVATALALDGLGRIVVAGRTCAAGSCDFALARYNTDGSLDTTFNSTGKVTTDFGGLDLANAIVLDGLGRIVVAGTTDAGACCAFALARYLP